MRPLALALLFAVLVPAASRAETAADLALRIKVLELRLRLEAEARARQHPAVAVGVSPLADYYVARRQAEASGKPLVVFVGIPFRTMPGKIVTCDVAEFPGMAGPCVICCTVTGGKLGDGIRLDGYPLDAAILAALHPGDAVAKWLAQPLNHGSCPCQQTGAGCHCSPHEDCARGGCKNHNPLLQGKPVSGNTPLPALPVFQSMKVCRT